MASKVKKYSKIIKKVTEKDISLIAEDINEQLASLSKFGKFYDDLVNDYLSLLTIRDALKEDIQEKGVRYTFTNGNGKEQEKANESVSSLIKVEQIMLKILNDLGINQPFIKPPTDKNNQEIGPDEDDLL